MWHPSVRNCSQVDRKFIHRQTDTTPVGNNRMDSSLHKSRRRNCRVSARRPIFAPAHPWYLTNRCVWWVGWHDRYDTHTHTNNQSIVPGGRRKVRSECQTDFVIAVDPYGPPNRRAEGLKKNGYINNRPPPNALTTARLPGCSSTSFKDGGTPTRVIWCVRISQHCMHICLLVCLSISLSVCMHVYVYVCMYVCMYVYMYVCMYVPVRTLLVVSTPRAVLGVRVSKWERER